MPANSALDWDVWIQDSLTPLRSRSYVRTRLEASMSRSHFTVVSGPNSILPVERYPGQWVLRVRDPFGMEYQFAEERIRDFLHGTGFFLAQHVFAVQGSCSVSVPRPKRKRAS
jgi:hypothetical protein